tara:strand:+ start:2155 stop:3093 length:939 start_codon:yes stop_codon:yes gene_type:complete
MIISKGRILGLCCIIACLIASIIILQNLVSENAFSQLSNLLNPSVLLLLVLLYACHFFAEPIRWSAYALHIQGQSKFISIFACFNITALLSYSLPLKLGLPLRLFLLSHFLKLKGKKIIQIMTMDGFFSLASWSIIALLLIISIPEIGDYYSSYISPVVLLLALFGLGLLLLWLLRLKGWLPLATFRSVPGHIIILVLLTLTVDILLYGVRHLVIVEALGIEISSYQIFAISIVAVFAGIISTLPMGLGAYDVSLMALMSLYGVDIEMGLIVAFTNRLGMILTSILFGAPSSLALLHTEIPDSKLQANYEPD